MSIPQAQQMTMQAMAMVTTSPISSPPTSPPPTPYIPYTPLPFSPYSTLPSSPYTNLPPSPYAQAMPSAYTISSSVIPNPDSNHQLKTTKTSTNMPEQVKLCLTYHVYKNCTKSLYTTIYNPGHKLHASKNLISDLLVKTR